VQENNVHIRHTAYYYLQSGMLYLNHNF